VTPVLCIIEVGAARLFLVPSPINQIGLPPASFAHHFEKGVCWLEFPRLGHNLMPPSRRLHPQNCPINGRPWNQPSPPSSTPQHHNTDAPSKGPSLPQELQVQLQRRFPRPYTQPKVISELLTAIFTFRYKGKRINQSLHGTTVFGRAIYFGQPRPCVPPLTRTSAPARLAVSFRNILVLIRPSFIYCQQAPVSTYIVLSLSAVSPNAPWCSQPRRHRFCDFIFCRVR
jgi:hypothetical protein